MHRRKRDLLKASIAIAGMLLLLALMAWVPASATGAYERASGLAEPGTVTVQETPTVDATVTALNKEKLAQEVQQLKNQNESDTVSWLRTNLSVFLSTLVVVIGGLVGYLRWLRDRRDEHKKRREDQRSEREKRAEERFQSAVTGLGDEKEGAKIGAAILLRTFLRPDYKQFYTQTFDIAVANLRLPRTPHPPEDPNTPLPLTTLSQALITVFKESFPLARDEWIKSRKDEPFDPRSLDATGIQLDNAYLREADLKQAWMRHASLRNVDLRGADLREANLRGADLREAYPREADLREANLREADLRGAWFGNANLRNATLREARLEGASLNETDLSDADLRRAYLKGAYLNGAYLKGAYLSGADLRGADLGEANIEGVALRNVFEDALSGKGTNLHGADLRGANLKEANIEEALSLKDTDLRGVKGLTKEQLAICKAKGALINEDATASSSQSTVSPPVPSQSNDVQAQSAPSAQGSIPTPETDDSNAPSSKPGHES